MAKWGFPLDFSLLFLRFEEVNKSRRTRAKIRITSNQGFDLGRASCWENFD